LEPLSGYLLLAQKLYEEGPAFAESWNFGPLDSDAKPVKWIVQKMCEKWDGEANYLVDGCNKKPHEANFLKLDCSKAHTKLDWHPKWSLDKALDKILEWASAYRDGKNLFDISISQIEEYSK
jgi:CDP-glucose 4,6-dehydratase